MLDEPLGLTVHSLPSPQEAVEGDGRRTRSGTSRAMLPSTADLTRSK